MMWRLVREDWSLRFWRVLIFDPPTRRRRCYLSTFSVAPYTEVFCLCTQNSGKPHGRRIGTRECSNVKPLRLRDTALAALDGVCSRLRCCTPLPLCYTLFQRLRCCPIPPLFKVLLAEPSRSVLHCEQESYYHRLLSQRAVHSHYSPAASVDWSHRCSLATLFRSVRRRSFPAIGYGNTPWRSAVRNKRV